MSAGESAGDTESAELPGTLKFQEAVEPPELTVPYRHGQRLISPPLDKVIKRARMWREAVLGTEGAQPNAASPDFFSAEFVALRQAARRSAVELAIQYTSRYRSGLACSPNDWQLPIVMGGHQPDLFHCGVWFKNILLSQIAQQTRGLAIHFLVDNDLSRTTSIQVPFCQATSLWQTKQVFYDTPRDHVPWENCFLQDTALWRSFPNRVRQVLPKLQGEPMIARLWEHTLGDAVPGATIGTLLSSARHRLEQEMGLQTLEVPLSCLVSTPEFVRFSLHLLRELPRLHTIYNAELLQYRQVHRIRNHAQPLPNLGQDSSWYEIPWWYYARGSQVRYPLWARLNSGSLLLSNRQGWQLSLSDSSNFDSAVEKWMQELAGGSCLRPRALLTTMYARLILCDLFVHGMGGARYDQLTDRIMARFFGVQPPPVVLATATMHLPFAEMPRELIELPEQNVLWWQQLLRVFQSNPEAGFRQWSQELPAEQIDELHRLQAAKQALLGNIPPKGQKWQWHTDMKQIHERLAELARPSVNKIQATIGRLEAVEDLRAIVHSREFSFCLFPMETIFEHLKAP